MDFMNLVLPLLIVATFYFFIIMPQKKARGQQEAFSESLAKGMQIVTTSGIYGQINKVEGDIIHVQVDSKTFLRFSRSAISREMTEQAYAPKDEKAKTA